MHRIATGIVFLVTSLWLGLAQADGSLMAHNAWIREAPPGATALAGYMTLMNQGEKPVTLVGAASPAFGKVMLHRTVMADGMAKMVHQQRITIPAKANVVFEPNDYHLMLMKPKQLLKAGDRVEITLELDNGETLVVTHEVRAGMGEMEHGGMDHSDMHH